MSPRAPKICAAANCPNIADNGKSHCSEHAAKPWASNTPKPARITGRRSQRRRRYVLSRDNGICWICGEPMADQADHVIPLAEGGADTVDNLKAAHATCNATKAQAEAARGRARQQGPL